MMLSPSVFARVVTLAALVAPGMLSRDASAQSRYILDSRLSKVTFEGRALITSVVGRSQELTGAIVMADGDVKSIRGDVRFPVRSLETQPAISSRELRRLFGEDTHPDIVFFVDSLTAPSSRQRWLLHGRLSMNGVSRPIAFATQAIFTTSGMETKGSVMVDLRDWRIKPPRRLGGLVAMSSRVRLLFHATFSSRDGTHASLGSPNAEP